MELIEGSRFTVGLNESLEFEGLSLLSPKP